VASIIMGHSTNPCINLKNMGQAISSKFGDGGVGNHGWGSFKIGRRGMELIIVAKVECEDQGVQALETT
jgi:hypothetical protein